MKSDFILVHRRVFFSSSVKIISSDINQIFEKFSSSVVPDEEMEEPCVKVSVFLKRFLTVFQPPEY